MKDLEIELKQGEVFNIGMDSEETLSVESPNQTIIKSDKNYTHTQTIASAEWEIVHNLNKYPTVAIIDSAGDEVIGDIKYNSINKITISFSGAFKGSATLN